MPVGGALGYLTSLGEQNPRPTQIQSGAELAHSKVQNAFWPSEALEEFWSAVVSTALDRTFQRSKFYGVQLIAISSSLVSG